MKTEINRDPVGDMIIESVNRPQMVNEISVNPAVPTGPAKAAPAIARNSLLARRYARWDRRAARNV